MNDEENLTLHQTSLKALFHAPLQFEFVRINVFPALAMEQALSMMCVAAKKEPEQVKVASEQN